MFDRQLDHQRVLGIDPGLSRCGYGAVERAPSGVLRAVACGVVRTDRALAVPDRLASLQDELERLVDELEPSAVVVERVLFQANARTAISVGQASGIALVVAARRGLRVAEYSPNETKLAVTGDGRADKRAVQTMVARLLRLERVPSPPDAADALALAITHCVRDCRTSAATSNPAGSGFRRAVAAALERVGGAR